jgi:hypothetical protein
MNPDEATEIINMIFTAARKSHHDGDILVDMLELAINEDAWRAYRRPMGEIQTYEPGEFTKFVTTPPSLGMGMDPKKLCGVIAAFGRDDLRERVESLLRADIPPARAHGGDRKSDQVCDTKLITDQQDVSYVVSRLKRDNPDIAADVINGTITPNAAAIKTGIRHPYARIRRDNINQAIRVLLRDYTRDQIMHALETH